MHRTAAALLLAILTAVTLSFAQAGPAGQASRVDPVFKTSKGIAIKGYDVVAYFDQGKPAKGNSQFQFQWNGATWLFASAAHRDEFAKNPEKYTPQYGGYCAYGVSAGYAVPVDPKAWKIVNGKLYLNYDKGVQKEWQKDIPGNIAKADQNWPGLHR